MSAPPLGFGIREFLTTLFAHWRMIVGLSLLAGISAGGFALLQNKVWESGVRIVVQQNRQAVRIGTSEAPVTGPLMLSQGEQVRTEMQILSSPVVLAAAAETLGPERVLERMRWRWDWLRELPGEAVDAVRNFVRSTLFGRAPQMPVTPLALAMQRIADHMDVEPVRESSVFVVSVNAPDAQFSAELLNAIVQAYLAHHITVRQGAATSGIFVEETERARKELAAAVAREQALKMSSGIFEASAQRQLLLQRLNDTEAAYQRARVETIELQRRVALAETELSQRAPTTAVQNTLGRNPELDTLRQQLTQLEIERGNYRSGSQAARSLDVEIENTRTRLRSVQDRVNTSQISGPNATFMEIERTLVADRARLKALGAQSDLLQQIERYRLELQALDSNAATLDEATRDVALKEEALKVLQRKQHEERLGALLNERRVSDVVPIESAMVPDRPARPRVTLTTLIGLGTGLLAGLALAFLSEYLRRTISTREEAASQLGQPVLGCLVDRAESAAVALNQIELRRIAEAMRVEARAAERGIAVLVTSTTSGEGKTSLARELVRLLGTDDACCAYVDANFDRPVGGHRSDSELGANESLPLPVAEARQWLGKLRESTRLVIVDGPALGSSAEGLWLLELADCAIVVLQAERTTGFNAMRTIRMVQASGCRCLGVVLTRRRFVIPSWVYGWLLSPHQAMRT